MDKQNLDQVNESGMPFISPPRFRAELIPTRTDHNRLLKQWTIARHSTLRYLRYIRKERCFPYFIYYKSISHPPQKSKTIQHLHFACTILLDFTEKVYPRITDIPCSLGKMPLRKQSQIQFLIHRDLLLHLDNLANIVVW